MENGTENGAAPSAADAAYATPAMLAGWAELQRRLRERFGKSVKMEAILLLIGVQEVGCGFREFSKEEKMDLMNVGMTAALAEMGFFTFDRRDDDGWPHWSPAAKPPQMDLLGQTNFMRTAILRWFRRNVYEDLP